MGVGIPTKRLPDWASSGDVSDPGVSKEAAGWQVSERPPAQWINFIYKNVSDYLRYAEELALPVSAVSNMTNSNTTDFNGSGLLNVHSFKSSWEPTQKKYYMVVDESTSSTYRAYESTDGVSWGTGKVINPSLTLGTVSGIAYCDTNGRIGGAAEDDFYLSSSGAIADFGVAAGTFSTITGAREVIWDDVHDLWIAIGGHITDTQGAVETAPIAGTPWTTRNTRTNPALSLAYNRAGTSVMTYGALNAVYRSTDGTTWTIATAFGATLELIQYCPFAGIFIAVDSTQNVWSSPDGGTWTAAGWGTVRNLIVCEDYMLVIGLTAPHDIWFVDSIEQIVGTQERIRITGIAAEAVNVKLLPLENTRFGTSWVRGGTERFVYMADDQTRVTSIFRNGGF